MDDNFVFIKKIVGRLGQLAQWKNAHFVILSGLQNRHSNPAVVQDFFAQTFLFPIMRNFEFSKNVDRKILQPPRMKQKKKKLLRILH